MRALHFCFWLHRPYELLGKGKWEKGYFGGELEFKKADQRDYQPLLALIERNAQRYAKLRVSLVMSGVWLEQAERWDVELVARIKKLVEKGSVELIATPYDHSMAAFYDLDELAAQVEHMQEKYEQVFGKKATALALPELCYNNRLAKWAEKAGFQMMLAGDARESLDWRSCNRLYEAKGCEKLQVLFENVELSQMIAQSETKATEEVAEEIEMEQLDPDLAATKMTSAADFVQAMNADGNVAMEAAQRKVKTRTIFSAKNFQKQLDLAFLRGNIVNISLEAEIFGKWRERGIIGFFDEIFKTWSEAAGSHLAAVKELVRLAPAAEVSIKKTASSKGEAEKDYQIPGWWSAGEEATTQALYRLRAPILESREKDLYVDFARLTAMEYAKGGEQYEEVFQDVKGRTEDLVAVMDGERKTKARKMAESTQVKVKFDQTAKKQREKQQELYWQMRAATGDFEISPDDLDDVEATIQVLAQRMKQAKESEGRDLTDLAEAEVVDEDMGFEAADFGVEEESEVFEPEPEESGGEPEKASKKKKFKKIVID